MRIAAGAEEDKVLAEFDILASSVRRLQDGEFICPGLIDTHVHAPQYKACTAVVPTLACWQACMHVLGQTSFGEIPALSLNPELIPYAIWLGCVCSRWLPGKCLLRMAAAPSAPCTSPCTAFHTRIVHPRNPQCSA